MVMGSPGAKTFQEVLSAAIDDMIENGFDSMERVERWTRELRAAAERSLIDAASLDQQLRDALDAIYRRMVDHGQIARFHKGVERFTLERIRPALRSELDRRIMASANLIKLNRQESIDRTLRRFEGWSTSIPKGGTDAASKRETKETVRKSMAGLPFEERRVIIDQGHKLVASINEIIATDGGAIAATWRSNWKQQGYNYRMDHRERDGRTYLVRDSWAHKAALVKKNADGYYDEHEAAGQLPFCRCYIFWRYSLNQLPEDMLTSKGKAALAQARASGARADSESDNAESEVIIQNISTEPRPRSGLGQGGATPWPVVDRDHDVEWMSVISKDGGRLYVDRTIPREVEIKGKRIDPARILWAHELAEWLAMMQMLAAFLSVHLRQPNEEERVAMYEAAHKQHGIPAERKEAGRLKISWPEWEAWSRGELSRLEHRPIANPPGDAHVRPAPHDRREPMEALP